VENQYKYILTHPKVTIRDAIGSAIDEELARDSNVFLMGIINNLYKNIR
jgi:hypothetical protein